MTHHYESMRAIDFIDRNASPDHESGEQEAAAKLFTDLVDELLAGNKYTAAHYMAGVRTDYPMSTVMCTTPLEDGSMISYTAVARSLEPGSPVPPQSLAIQEIDADGQAGRRYVYERSPDEMAVVRMEEDGVYDDVRRALAPAEPSAREKAFLHQDIERHLLERPDEYFADLEKQPVSFEEIDALAFLIRQAEAEK